MASFKIRRILRAINKIHAGGDTNYSEYDSAGRLTMAGTGRVVKDIWISPKEFTKSASDFSGEHYLDAGSMISGSILLDASGSIFTSGTAAKAPVVALFPSVNITASMTFGTVTIPKPTDADTTGSIGVHMTWTSHDTNATAGSVFVFKAGMIYLASSAVMRTAGSCGASPAYNYTASATLYETDIGDLPSWGANDVAGVLVIGQDQQVADDTAGSGWAMLGVKLRYVANSLGTAAP